MPAATARLRLPDQLKNTRTINRPKLTPGLNGYDGRRIDALVFMSQGPFKPKDRCANLVRSADRFTIFPAEVGDIYRNLVGSPLQLIELLR